MSELLPSTGALFAVPLPPAYSQSLATHRALDPVGRPAWVSSQHLSPWRYDVDPLLRLAPPRSSTTCRVCCGDHPRLPLSVQSAIPPSSRLTFICNVKPGFATISN